LVTGGGRGIGRQIALKMALEGAHVAVAARTEREIKPVADEIMALGRRALAIPTDIGNEAQVAACVAAVEKAFGRIDVLVNSAAVTYIEPLVKTTLDQWRRTMDVNVTGAFVMTKAVVPAMIDRNDGRVINVSSTAGLEGFPNFAAFCASKFALIGLTRALAKEIEESAVTVNALCPALVGTKRGPQKAKERKAEPSSDVADVAVFLASDAARAVTGAAIEVSWRT
jgi:NAD(P)-dependent dehydrogenase (short-subunit alcohol dehydrogenase family)